MKTKFRRNALPTRLRWWGWHSYFAHGDHQLLGQTSADREGYVLPYAFTLSDWRKEQLVLFLFPVLLLLLFFFSSWFGNFIYHANRGSHGDVSETKQHQWREKHISPLCNPTFKLISLNDFSLNAPTLPKANCLGYHQLQVAPPCTQSKWINLPVRLSGRRALTGGVVASQHIPKAVPALPWLSVSHSQHSLPLHISAGSTFWLAVLSESWAWMLKPGRDSLPAAPSPSSWNPQRLCKWPMLERAHRHIKTV